MISTVDAAQTLISNWVGHTADIVWTTYNEPNEGKVSTHVRLRGLPYTRLLSFIYKTTCQIWWKLVNNLQSYGKKNQVVTVEAV